MVKPTAQDIARFERFVSPEPNTGCYLWAGAGTPTGYGYFQFGGRRGSTLGAHRFAYLAEHGEIPDGLDVLHRCDVPCCVNVEHLFLGTHGDNMRDMASKGRHRLNNRPLANRLKTHCRHGHPLSGSNLSIRKDGSRLCKQCRARIQANNRSKKNG